MPSGVILSHQTPRGAYTVNHAMPVLYTRPTP